MRIFTTLNYSNPIVFFDNGSVALDYLNKIRGYSFSYSFRYNMPKINGDCIYLILRKLKFSNSYEKLHLKCNTLFIFHQMVL